MTFEEYRNNIFFMSDSERSAAKQVWNYQQDRINKLLTLLDDIDTAGDMFKPTIDGYFKYVQRKVKEAHQYRSEGWDE